MSSTLLKKVDLLKNLPPATLETLANICKWATIGPEEILFEDGETGDKMFAVLEGELAVIKQGEKIARLLPGEVFGEMALIESKNRSATVQCITHCRLLEITKTQFYSLLATDDNFLLALLNTLSDRSRGNIRDLALGYRKKKAQEKISAHLHRILDESPNEIYIIDTSNHSLVRINSMAGENLGYSAKEIAQMNYFDVIQNLDRKQLEQIAKPLHEGKRTSVTHQGIHKKKNGNEYKTEVRIQLLETEDKAFYVLMAQDKTENQLMQETIKTLANYDSLTGLPNLNLAKDRLSVAISQADRYQRKVAVLIINIDNFKTINHSLGSNGGELLLMEVGKRLSACLRDEDTVARLEGEEFLLILPGTRQQQSTTVLAPKVLDALEPLFTVDNKEINVSTTIGISVFPDDGSDPNTLIKNADAAMFRAKQAGNNNFEYYNPTFLDLATLQMSIESGLRKALEQEEFFLFYQPKIACRTGDFVGLEALLRWKHPEKGWIPPCDFIPIAEENRFILQIGEWVINTACAQLSLWQSKNLDPGNVAINISGHQFNQKKLVQIIGDAVDKYSIPPNCLELEFTETILMEHSKEALSRLNALKELGVKLSIDDFGTGYSSLTYLKNMPVDYLKIDQSFIKEFDQEANQAIIRTIISLAQSLKMKTIAEGVETDEARDFLTSLGCDYMQGYLFSPALPHEELTKKYLIPAARI